MPCPAWGIPKARCKTGGKLSKKKNTVCSKCYGRRGPISWPAAVSAQEDRYTKWKKSSYTDWIMAMESLIAHEVDSHFRWFDMGDLQSVGMVRQIIKIAEDMPWVKFWLPTQERKFIEQVKTKSDIPDNLTIRLSTPRIDGAPCGCHPHTTTVATAPSSSPNLCTAHERGNQCGPCRMCWDKTVPNVIYPLR